MRNRHWKTWRPSSLQEAVEGCVSFAQHNHRRDVERIADLVGESKWTLYKWIEQGSIPSKKIPGFEHACGCFYVTAYLAASARKLLIDLPTGRASGPQQIQALQEACNTAVGALISFAQQKASSDDVVGAINRALEHLVYERTNVALHKQPTLDFERNDKGAAP